MKINNNTRIILATAVMFLLGAAYLAYSETKQADLDAGKNWWTLSFVDPKSDNLSFAIENHSSRSDFHYSILVGTERVLTGSASVARGKTKDVELQNIEADGKVTIEVNSGTDKKEIYKSL